MACMGTMLMVHIMVNEAQGKSVGKSVGMSSHGKSVGMSWCIREHAMGCTSWCIREHAMGCTSWCSQQCQGAHIRVLTSGCSHQGAHSNVHPAKIQYRHYRMHAWGKHLTGHDKWLPTAWSLRGACHNGFLQHGLFQHCRVPGCVTMASYSAGSQGVSQWLPTVQGPRVCHRA